MAAFDEARNARLAGCSSGGKLRIALSALGLALGFAGVFDMVMIATAWQHLKHEAEAIAEAAAAARDDAVQLLLNPPGQLEQARLTLSRQGRDGDGLALWRDGVALRPDKAGPKGRCGPRLAFIASLSQPLPDWLIAAPLVRAILPHGVRAGAVACAPPGPDAAPTG